MSSKFSGILSQARNRAPQEDNEIPMAGLRESEIDVNATQQGLPTGETDPLPRASPTSNISPTDPSPLKPLKATPAPLQKPDQSRQRALEHLYSKSALRNRWLRNRWLRNRFRRVDPRHRIPYRLPCHLIQGLKKGGGRPRGKRSDPNFTQITAYISKQTHQGIKMALLREGQSREISQLIEERLVAWLAKQNADD